MPLPNIEDFTPMLDRACADYVGEPVSYQPKGGAFGALMGHVDYRDAIKSLDIAEAIEQDITVALLKVDVPIKPSGACRLRLGKLPGRLFQPINVRSDAAGTEWNFEVKDIPDA